MPRLNSADQRDELAREFLGHRPRLLGIAYRLLGSAWDAEDAVAEAQVRWLAVDRAQVREPAAFLTTVVTRLALDQLRSARARRERYVGPWLPEPVLTGAAPAAAGGIAGPAGPLDTLERHEALSLATLRMMEALTPPERAVLVLHDAFDLPYAEITDILGISVDAARQHLHRARDRVGGDRKRFEPDPHEHEALFERVLQALEGGDLDGLREALAADVVAYSDGGGKARAARHPIVGADRVAAFFGALSRRLAVRDVRRVELNGRPGAVLRFGDQVQVLAVDVEVDGDGDAGKVREIHSIMNPDKLSYLRRQLADRP